MKKHISFPSIDQFRNCVRAVCEHAEFTGKFMEQDGQTFPVYDDSRPKPVIKFHGTVKLHGTNAGVSYNEVDGIWFQSRENIITPVKDNAGFAFFGTANQETLIAICKDIAVKNSIDLKEHTISLYGEWVGQSIQSGVAISKIPKSFFLFGAKVSKTDDEDFVAYWVDFAGYSFPEQRIFNILDYPSYEIEIDFNDPAAVQDKLAELTEAVEKQCPVAKQFDAEGIGEGIVWSGRHEGNSYRFKIKGLEHRVSKTKVAVPIDAERLASIGAFVDYAVTPARLDQAMEKVLQGQQPDVKFIGDILKWMMQDIIKEETDTMVKNNFVPKDVTGAVCAKTKEMYFELLKV